MPGSWCRKLIAISTSLLIQGCIPVSYGFLQTIEAIAVDPSGARIGFIYNNGQRRFYTLRIETGEVLSAVDIGTADLGKAGQPQLAPTQDCGGITRYLASSTKTTGPADASVDWLDQNVVYITLGGALLKVQDAGSASVLLPSQDLATVCPSGPVTLRFREVSAGPVLSFSDGIQVAADKVESITVGAFPPECVAMKRPIWSKQGTERAALCWSQFDVRPNILVFNQGGQLRQVAPPDPWKISEASVLAWHSASDTFAFLVDASNESFSRHRIGVLNAGRTLKEFEFSTITGLKFSNDGSKLYVLNQALQSGGDYSELIELNIQTGAKRTLLNSSRLPRDQHKVAR